MFCCTLLYVHSSIAIILMGKRERFVIVVFPDHTHLLLLLLFIHCMCGLRVKSLFFLRSTLRFSSAYNSLNGEERAGSFGFLVFLISCGCCHSLPLLCGTLSDLWCALMAFPSHTHLPFHIYYND